MFSNCKTQKCKRQLLHTNLNATLKPKVTLTWFLLRLEKSSNHDFFWEKFAFRVEKLITTNHERSSRQSPLLLKVLERRVNTLVEYMVYFSKFIEQLDNCFWYDYLSMLLCIWYEKVLVWRESGIRRVWIRRVWCEENLVWGGFCMRRILYEKLLE